MTKRGIRESHLSRVSTPVNTGMPSNNYRRGVAFEREVRKLFEAAGYSVIRGAGSKGAVFNMKADLVATKDDGKTAAMVIIQCKTRRHP